MERWVFGSLTSPVRPQDPLEGAGDVELRAVFFQERWFLQFRFDYGARLCGNLCELRELLFIFAQQRILIVPFPPPLLLNTLHYSLRKYLRYASVHLRRDLPLEPARVQPRLRIAFRRHPL